VTLFAISDLHLSLSGAKPMDRFGEIWERHWEKVERHWRNLVGEQDVVLLPGDHSWAMRLEEARPDLEFIQSLPGRKILVRGNHDYWWHSIRQLRRAFPGLTFLQNDAILLDGVGICGTRGWLLPGSEGFAEAQDEKIYLREVERLRLSLSALPSGARHRVAMLHYPPLLPHLRDTGFTELLERYEVEICVYGHLHKTHRVNPFRGQHRGVSYYVVSCDLIDFCPLRLPL
jgi:predicted phosphohydrolase